MVLRVTVWPGLIGGDVEEGYGKVADVFRRNMFSGNEVGAAVSVYRDGVKVVDLWGGFRNGITKAQWEEDTRVNMFSTTKGVASLAIAVAAAQGLISYGVKVADYWPEFAQASKGSITVRQLLSHQAGLPAIDAALTLHDLADPAKMSAVLAAQAPPGPLGRDTATTPSPRGGHHRRGDALRRAAARRTARHHTAGRWRAGRQGQVPISAPLLFTANDCLDIGVCLGSPVSMDYYERAPFPFEGHIETVHVAYT